MELKTKFSQKQLAFIKVWSEDWCFNEDMILLAYELTLDNTGGMNFNYTNKILENWHNDGLSTREAVEQNAKNRAAKTSAKKPLENSSIDMNDIMKDVLQQYHNNEDK